MLVLKSPQDKVASNIAISGTKRRTSQIYRICQRDLEIMLLILQPAVQCDVPAVKNTSLVD